MSLEESNQRFIDGLKEGHKWQLYIGMKLLSEGFIVQIPKLRIRSSLYHVNIYSDSGDVFVFIKSNKYIFECKSISVWHEKEIYDKVKNYTKPFLFIDKHSHHIKSWQYLIDWLKERENEEQ